VPELPNLDHLSHAEKDALIRALWQRLEAAERRIAELEARLAAPDKTPANSSLPPSKGQKPNRLEKIKRTGPRKGSLGRKGGQAPPKFREETSKKAVRPGAVCEVTMHFAGAACKPKAPAFLGGFRPTPPDIVCV
jgi:hypothetical protein